MARDPADPGTFEMDYGDPELNDPEYENKVGTADAPANAPADTVTQERATPDTVTPQQRPATEPAGAPAGEGGAGGKPGQQPPAPVGGTRSDDKGNLVDAKGNIVAAAGSERRYYERVQQQAKHIRNLERDLTAARATSDMSGVLNDMPSKLGLGAQETELGLQIMSSMRKDPVGTARWLLQETMKLGYSLPQIVGAKADGTQPLSGSMDLGAVRAMIADAMAPLVGDRQASMRDQQIAADAQRDYDAFIAKHENASVHEETLANMLAADDSLTPETAYWQLVAFTARNGLDFTKPLGAQVLARQQGQPQHAAPNGNAQPRPAQHPAAAMPNGSPMTADLRQSDGMAAPDDSWDTIVQQSLREAGLV